MNSLIHLHLARALVVERVRAASGAGCRESRSRIRSFGCVAVVVALLLAVAAVRTGDAEARVAEPWTRTVQLRHDPGPAAVLPGRSVTPAGAHAGPGARRLGARRAGQDAWRRDERAITAAGLTLGTQRSVVDDTCNDIGAVLSQTQSAGTRVAPGTAVNLTIGQRPTHPCP